MSCDQMWLLDRYARFIKRSESDGGLWKPYGNDSGKLVLSLTKQNQLVITQGTVSLESHNLLKVGSFMRGLSKTDSLLFLFKLQNETRRFKVKFLSAGSKTGQEICFDVVKILSKFMTIKTNIKDVPNAISQSGKNEFVIAGNNPNHPMRLCGEVTIGTMTKAVLDKTNLPLAYYQCEDDPTQIQQLLQLCLADPTFPAYIQAVESSIHTIISQCSDGPTQV